MAARGTDDDVSYEIHICTNGNWIRFATVDTPKQAQEDAVAALTARKYAEAYKIVCKRRDGRTGKVNKISFAPVARGELVQAATDQTWQRHVEGKPLIDRPRRGKPWSRLYSWGLPVVFLALILFGAIYTLEFLRAQIFAK